MNISESGQDGVVILKIIGRLDAGTAADAEARISASIEAGAKQVVLDLSSLDYISSAGLRVLLTTARHAQRAQGKLVLADASLPVRQVLDMAGFASIIPVFDSVEKACGYFGSADGATLPPPCPLSFAEEIYLLALDEEKGKLRPRPSFVLEYAMAGALLMDLALADRIDADLSALKVISETSMGDRLLDEVLRELCGQPRPQPISFWLKELADQSREIEQRVLDSLVRKGVLRRDSRKILWVFQVHRYPVLDNRDVKEVRTRLHELILGDDIPEPRDIVLISLGNACRLMATLFTAEAYEEVRPRISALARLDMIGQEMYEAICEIERAMAQNAALS